MRRKLPTGLLLIGAVCLAFLSFARGQAAPVPDDPDGLPASGGSIHVDVRLVNVFTSVTNAQGAPVEGLQASDFQLFEDGVPQKIAVFSHQSSLPLSLILAIDTSLSTRLDLKFEQKSAQRFVHDVLAPQPTASAPPAAAHHQDAIALYEFSRDVNELVPFTSDLKKIDRGIDDLTPGSTTALYDAVYLGARALNGRRGKKVLLLISDGGDEGSNLGFQESLRAAQTAQAMIYSVIIVPIHASAGRELGGEHALIELSRSTGGKSFYADSIASLDQVFSSIRDELRTQYLLAYYPVPRDADSDFRSIQLKLAPDSKWYGQALTLRYRSGYYTSKLE